MCRHYPVAFTAVQADFEVLPFEAGQFDLVVFDAALHYANGPSGGRSPKRARAELGGRRRRRGLADVR